MEEDGKISVSATNDGMVLLEVTDEHGRTIAVELAPKEAKEVAEFVFECSAIAMAQAMDRRDA